MRKVLSLILPVLFVISCSGPGSFEELKSEGLKKFSEGDYAKARKYLIEALKEKPSDKELLYFTGMSYKREYLYDSALVYLKRADIFYPKDREINKELYEVALAMEEWEYAITALMTMVDTGDKLENYYYQLADLYAKIDYPLNIFYYLKRAWEKGMDDPSRFLQLANASATVDSLELAFLVIDSAISRFGDDIRFLASKAKFYAFKEDYKTAEKMMRSVLERDTSSAETKFNLANILSLQDSKKKKNEALDLYRQVKPFIRDYNIDSTITALEEELK
ncbi:MAG: tetratricopeptide repeat protein [Candidatus Zixiibacteriota bacterium]